jgi:exonuclease SbcD
MVADTARRESVDLVLIAGDLFDSSRVEPAVVENAIQTLTNMGITTVILPGNHDQLDGTSPFERLVFKDIASSIHLITEVEGELIHLSELGVTIWGRAMDEHSPSFQPLRGIPSLDGSDWRIAMAHGFHVSRGEIIDRSSLILAEEIATLDVDYLALGHVHVFRDVSEGDVKAYYSGAPDESYFVDKYGASVGHAALITFDPDFGAKIMHTPLIGG